MPKRKAPRAKNSKSSAKAKRKISSASKKSARRKRVVRTKQRITAARRAPSRARRSRVRPGVGGNVGEVSLPARPAFGPDAAGQSGDIEDLRDTATVDSES